MRLYLKNIGAIKEADVKLDGLTVIAGENDTGKSTVGKSLFALAKARFFVKNNDYLNKIEWVFDKISKKQLINKNSYLRLDSIEVDFNKNFTKKGNFKFLDVIFIETPFIFNLYKTLSGINKANSIIDFDIEYNYLWWDLYIKLSHKAKTFSKIDFSDLIKNIENIVNGKFIKYDEINKDKWVFVKNKELEMDNVAMGIKQFAILYALIKNGYLTKDRILVFDEPEVHLHPKWQIEYAKLIVELVKKGIKVLITSHSPFFIEAIEILSKNINPNFYLAKMEKDNYSFIKEVDVNEIYELLSESIDTLEEMEIESKRW